MASGQAEREALLAAHAPRGTRWLQLWLHGDPHRFSFSAGAAMLAACAAWWAWRVLGHQGGGMHAAVEAHAVVMTFGFMPLFFAGFLAETGSRWLSRPPLRAEHMALPVLLQLAGWVAFFAAVPVAADDAARLAALGLLAVAAGWALPWLRFAALVRLSRGPDRAHAGVIAIAGGVGLLSMLVAADATANRDLALERAAVHVALWIFIGGTFAAAAHRMIPFLGGATLAALDTRRPRWLLEGLATMFVLEGVCDALQSVGAALPPAVQGLRAALEALAGAGLLAVAGRWGFVQNLRIRLLAMLRLAVAWLGLSFVLAAASHALSLSSARTLGAAPLHAYAMGFLGSTMFAMVARFISGHAGRAVAADAMLWRLFLLLQLAIAARVAGGVMDAQGLAQARTPIAVAAAAWAIACTLWAARYLPWLAATRVRRPRRAA